MCAIGNPHSLAHSACNGCIYILRYKGVLRYMLILQLNTARTSATSGATLDLLSIELHPVDVVGTVDEGGG